MPQIKAAKKALRVSARKRTVNDRWRQKVRTLSRELKNAIVKPDKKVAQSILTKLQSTLDKTAQRNIIPQNRAARQKAQFTKSVSSIG